MAGPYLPIRAISRSQAVRVGGQKVSATENTYVDISGEQTNTPRAYSALKELRSHLALGAVIVVGPITESNTPSVIFSGAAVTKAKGATAEETEVKIAAGELRNRNTGLYVTVAGTNVKLTEVAASKERLDLVYVDETTGALEKKEGTAAAEGAAVLPALPANKLLVATLKSTNKNATNTLTLVTPRP